MNPETWAEMVRATRQLERALGSGDKTVADNERQTVVIQRRCLRAARDIQPGETLTREMVDVLRPATNGAIMPYEIQDVVGLKALERIAAGQELCWSQFGAP
jgi:N-acetylneuraminate synthase